MLYTSITVAVVWSYYFETIMRSFGTDDESRGGGDTETAGKIPSCRLVQFFVFFFSLRHRRLWVAVRHDVYCCEATSSQVVFSELNVMLPLSFGVVDGPVALPP